MTKAIVIRTAGDPEISRQIVNGLESAEMKRLRVELQILKRRDAIYWQNKFADMRRKYAKDYARATKKHCGLYDAFCSFMGMIIAIQEEANERR